MYAQIERRKITLLLIIYTKESGNTFFFLEKSNIGKTENIMHKSSKTTCVSTNILK